MFYTIVRALVKIAFLILGLKCEGLHNIPEKGSVIIAANHVSYYDPIIVAISANRPVYFMAKAELFKHGLVRVVLQGLHAFPVKRGTADRTAIRQAVSILQDGNVLGIFPQGTRQKILDETRGQAGVAMLALKSGAVVIPAACIGTERSLPLGWTGKFKVKFGKPLNLQQYYGVKTNSATLEKVSKEVMKEINKLLSE